MQDFRMETFLTVCEKMNFTKAAQKLGLTQPAISQHIRFLEEEYGVKLFRMNGRKIQLTDAGKLLKSAALTMKHDEIYLKNKMRRTADKNKEYLFGATLTVADYILGARLVEFQKRHPQSRIMLYVGNTKELLAKIDSGELDFAIIEGYYLKEDYESYLFRDERYLAVGAKGSAARLQGKKLDQLLDETLIIREKGSGTRKVLEKILAEQNLSLYDFRNVLEIGSISVIKQLVEADCGITFLYEAAVEREITEGRLENIMAEGWDYAHSMTFIYRKGSIFREEYQKIFNEMRQKENRSIYSI